MMFLQKWVLSLMACLFLCRVFGGRGRCGSGPSVISGCWRHTRTPNHTTPWCTSNHTIPWCTSKPYHTIPYLTILYNTILWCHGVPLHHTIPYNPNHTTLCWTELFHISSYPTKLEIEEKCILASHKNSTVVASTTSQQGERLRDFLPKKKCKIKLFHSLSNISVILSK